MEEEKKKNEQVEEEMEEDEVLNPDDFEDDSSDEDLESEEDEGSSDDDDKDEEEKKEKEKRAKAAERRRREEAREKAKKQREAKERQIREDAKLEAELGIIKTNPYTEQPITDAEDLKIYKLQRELEEEGKDPINDLPQRIALRNRQAAKEAKELAENKQKEETERQSKINAEIKELRTKYPKVNTVELANDPLFQKCLEGRAGRWTQVEIYEFYLAEKAKAETEQKEKQAEKAADNNADKASNPPSSSARGKSAKKTIEDMSDEEFEAYFKNKYNS